MSPRLQPLEEAAVARTAMSEKELRRVEVLERVVSGELRLGDAAVLLQVSYRQAKRLARCYRQGGRARKEHFGELVQLDGSFHHWFERRGPRGCLMNMVDDATGVTHAWLRETETTCAAVHVLRGWIAN